MRDAVIVDVLRTPSGRGKPGGVLSHIHPVDLLAGVLQALVSRNALDPSEIDDVIGGCVTQSGEQSTNITRHAVLAAGFPFSVPATTVDRQCGSSQQAIHFAAYAIQAGAADIVVACGVESMSHVPMFSNVGSADRFGSLLTKRFPGGLISQGISAELVCSRWNLTREELDKYAVRSHERAAVATATGAFRNDLVPVPALGPGSAVTEIDETIRPATTMGALAGLRPSFCDPRLLQRFPEIEWRVTAGNSSPVSDGAAAVLLMSEERAVSLGLRARARVHATAVVGDDPILMLMGVVPATLEVLRRARMDIANIDVFEVNEAFASVPLAWLQDLKVDPDKLNVHGGAIALGHPLGASGARLMGTLVGALERRGERYGLQTMCEAGGMANATIIERL
jgi:acetyl-CoA acyltransferase